MPQGDIISSAERLAWAWFAASFDTGPLEAYVPSMVGQVCAWLDVERGSHPCKLAVILLVQSSQVGVKRKQGRALRCSEPF
jgi:hypothetical protein